MSIATTAQPAENPSGAVAAPVPPAETAPPTSSSMNTDLPAISQSALADAARRTGIDKSALQLVSAEAVTWQDGSLGCPEPGMLYTQALVPGYRIRIRAGAEVLDYHASARAPAQLILCPMERAIDPLPDGRT